MRCLRHKIHTGLFAAFGLSAFNWILTLSCNNLAPPTLSNPSSTPPSTSPTSSKTGRGPSSWIGGYNTDHFLCILSSTFVHFHPLLSTFIYVHPFSSISIPFDHNFTFTFSLSHFHFHTFTFTLSLLHFHFYTFTFTLSHSNFHIQIHTFTFKLSLVWSLTAPPLIL